MAPPPPRSAASRPQAPSSKVAAAASAQRRLAASKPKRHRAGKASGPEVTEDIPSSSSEEESAPEDESEGHEEIAQRISRDNEEKQRPEVVTSKSLANLDLDKRRKEAEKAERKRKEEEAKERARFEAEAGFLSASDESETEGKQSASSVDEQQRSRRKSYTSSSEDESERSSSEESSSEESSSSSDEERKPKLRRPVFLSKSQREAAASSQSEKEAALNKQADEEKRKANLDNLVQQRINEEAALKASSRHAWDDTETAASAFTSNEAEIDDTDGLDPALEHQQWVLRFLNRMKRARRALEEREAAIAESERRAGLTAEERAAEDAEKAREADEDRKATGEAKKMGSEFARYAHRGAFFQPDTTTSKGNVLEDDEAAKARAEHDRALFSRNLMGARFADQSSHTAALPEYLQVKDTTRIGRKGRSKYKNLKAEDTGKWANERFDNRQRFGLPSSDGDASKGRREGDVTDTRFQADPVSNDDYQNGNSSTGANASALGTRRRRMSDENYSSSKRTRQ